MLRIYDSEMNHMDWDGLRLLLAVHEAGSLRAAAGVVGVSQPTLGRRLRALEESLGQPLVLRHARGMALTDEGRAVLQAARRVDAQVADLRRALSGRATAVSGRVRVSCTEPVATDLLGPSLIQLRDDHPELAVDVVVDAHASDLDRRDADIAVRMFQPRRASLVARRLGSTFTGFYASRAYLARHGRPEALPDLVRHRVIGPDRDPLFVQQAASMGFSAEQMTYRTDSFATVLSWVRQGVAIGALLGCVANRDPELVGLLQPLVEHPVWLVTHPDLRAAAPVDAVWQRLAADLPLLLKPVGP